MFPNGSRLFYNGARMSENIYFLRRIMYSLCKRKEKANARRYIKKELLFRYRQRPYFQILSFRGQ